MEKLLMEDEAFQSGKISQEQLSWLKEYRKVLTLKVGDSPGKVELEMKTGLQRLKDAEKFGWPLSTPEETAEYYLQ